MANVSSSGSYYPASTLVYLEQIDDTTGTQTAAAYLPSANDVNQLAADIIGVQSTLGTGLCNIVPASAHTAAVHNAMNLTALSATIAASTPTATSATTSTSATLAASASTYSGTVASATVAASTPSATSATWAASAAVLVGSVASATVAATAYALNGSVASATVAASAVVVSSGIARVFNVTDYGAAPASGNNATPFASAIGAASAAGMGLVCIDNGTYEIASSTLMASNVSVYIAPGASIKASSAFNVSGGQEGLFKWPTSCTDAYVINHGLIDGNGAASASFASGFYGVIAYANNIVRGGYTDDGIGRIIDIPGANVVAGDAVCVGSSAGSGLYPTDMRFGDITAKRCFRNGVSLTACSGLSIRRIDVSDSVGINPGAAIDIEPNTDRPCTDIHIGSVKGHKVYRGVQITDSAGTGWSSNIVINDIDVRCTSNASGNGWDAELTGLYVKASNVTVGHLKVNTAYRGCQVSSSTSGFAMLTPPDYTNCTFENVGTFPTPTRYQISEAFPTTPTPEEGDRLYRSDIDVDFLYDGSVWRPQMGYGAYTVYLAGNGNDANDGYTSGSPKLTLASAWAAVAPVNRGTVTISAGTGTFAGATLAGVTMLGGSTVTLQGAASAVLSNVVATTGASGGGATQGTVTASGAAYTVDAYANEWLTFGAATTTTGLRSIRRVIDTNASAIVTFVGSLPANPVSGDTFDVTVPGTIFNTAMTFADQRNMVCDTVTFTATPTVTRSSAVTWNYVQAPTPNVAQNSALVLERCHQTSRSIFNNCYAKYSLSKLTGYVWALAGSVVDFGWGSVIDGTDFSTQTGLYAIRNGVIQCQNVDYVRVRNFSGGNGCYAGLGGQITGTANNQYSGNAADETAASASYGYID